MWQHSRKLGNRGVASVTGGYAITHVCKLERLERNPFSVDDARDQLEASSYYFPLPEDFGWLQCYLLALMPRENRF